jgi:undecaprenyl-diphosphatase
MGYDMLQACLLAVTQGLTEFLPVSSSGHLVLVSWLFDWEDQGMAFDMVLHLGTVAAIILYFRREWSLLARGLMDSLRGVASLEQDEPYRRLSWLIILATIPALAIGALTESVVEDKFRDPVTVGWFLLGTGVLLFVAERSAKRGLETRGLNTRDALAIGVAQAAALLPGVSRSGVTIAAGLFRGLTREAAARFSFMLAAPIILGASLFEIWSASQEGWGSIPWPLFPLGFVVTGVVALVCIRGFLSLLRRATLAPFTGYCVAAGSVVLLVHVL